MDRHNKKVRLTMRLALVLPLVLTISGTLMAQICAQAPSSQPVPCGNVDSPINNSTGVQGAINVTGWTLSQWGGISVTVYRNPVSSAEGTGLILIGGAPIIAHARPDVAGSYPNYQQNDYGWGMQILTNLLPGTNGNAVGNGTYTLHIIASDAHSISTDFQVTFTTDNAHATKPFGTIDTPGQSPDQNTVSGMAYVNFGWALTPQPYMIPIDGSTINLVLDGIILPIHPVYNNYRSDIANTFPGYANSGSPNNGGAVGYIYLDTTTLANGVHTISWNVYDNAGRHEGIGSRYFNVSNSNLMPIDIFRNCVGPTGITLTCTLPTGSHTVNQSIPILRSNVTVTGNGAASQTLLVRGQNFTGPMMELGSTNDQPNTVALTGIKVQYLTFCSGGTRYHALNLVPGNPCLLTPQNALTLCETGSLPCLDLTIGNTGAGQVWASPAGGPFNNTGPYNVEIIGSNFEDSSSGHPIFISPGITSTGARQMVNDVYFHNNVITDGGVQIGASNGVNWDDYTQCDNWKATRTTDFEDDNGATWPVTPRNIRFDTNTFYSSAGAISGQGRYIGIYNNTFVATLGGGGGAIEQEVCSDQVKITGNTFTGGRPVQQLLNQGVADAVSGMELYARNLTVSGNIVSGFTYEGILFGSTYNASATGNHLYGNDVLSLTNKFVNGDIKARTAWQGSGTCTPAYAGNGNPLIHPIEPVTCDAWRDAQGITIQNNDSQGAPAGQPGNVQYGVYLPDHEGSTEYLAIRTPLLGGVISGNNLNVANVLQVANQPSSGQVVYHRRIALDTSLISSPSAAVADSSYPSYDPNTSTLPQTISIFPEGNQPLGTPLDLPGMPDPGDAQREGVNRRFFRFGGNDPGGASNIAHIQGFLSTGACPALAAILPYVDTPPSGVGGPYDIPPQSNTGSTCNLNGQPVGPTISPIYYCGFLFAFSDGGPTGTIYLENASHQFPAADSSPLGSMGHTVGNAFCNIHASTSSIQPAPSYCPNCAPNNVVVVLDVELLKSDCQPLYPVDPLHPNRKECTWFMYETVENNGLRFNIGDQGSWSLWGFWQTSSIQ